MDPPSSDATPTAWPSPTPPPPRDRSPSRPPAAPRASAGPRAGQLSLLWLAMTAAMWGLVFLSLTAVWKASLELGLATWWLGPFSDPNNVVVRLLPFAAPAAMIAATLSNRRWLPLGGLVAGALTTAVGVVDLGHVTRLGLVEIAVGAAAGGFSVGSFAGMYRHPA